MATPRLAADRPPTKGSEPARTPSRGGGGASRSASGPALPTRLAGRPLAAVRAAWLLTAAGLVGLATVGSVRALAEPQGVALPAVTDLFAAVGVSLRLMLVIVLVAPLVVVVGISAFVFSRRSDDPIALLSTMTLLALYVFGSRSLLTYEAGTPFAHAVSVTFAIAMVGLSYVYALFPDGRFVPRSGRWLGPAVIALFVAFPDAGRALMTLLDGDGPATRRIRVLVFLLATVMVLGLVAQAHRYRHDAGPTERQQAKWVIAPMGLQVLVIVAALAVTASGDGSERWVGPIILVVIPMGVLLPVMWANAILRYRLYEIDRIISRTVGYVLLSGLLVAVYLGAVFVLQQLLRPVTGESQLAVAGATLVVAALFGPLRRRVQATVDRRFDRSRYDAQRTIEAFRLRLRDELDLDELTTELIATVEDSVAPATVHVWFHGKHPSRG